MALSHNSAALPLIVCMVFIKQSVKSDAVFCRNINYKTMLLPVAKLEA